MVWKVSWTSIRISEAVDEYNSVSRVDCQEIARIQPGLLEYAVPSIKESVDTGRKEV